MNLEPSTIGSAARLHGEYLARQDARACLMAQRWRAATRVSLVALLAGAALQLYLIHVYATIAALPTLGVTIALSR